MGRITIDMIRKVCFGMFVRPQRRKQLLYQQYISIWLHPTDWTPAWPCLWTRLGGENCARILVLELGADSRVAKECVSVCSVRSTMRA